MTKKPRLLPRLYCLPIVVCRLYGLLGRSYFPPTVFGIKVIIIFPNAVSQPPDLLFAQMPVKLLSFTKTLKRSQERFLKLFGVVRWGLQELLKTGRLNPENRQFFQKETFTPGPMVEVRVALRRLFGPTAPTTASRFLTRSSSLSVVLPMLT